MKPIKLTTNTEDETLVQFLRTYDPSVPSDNEFNDDIIINQITAEQQIAPPTVSKAPVSKAAISKAEKRHWLLPTTIISTALLIFSGNALKAKFMPQIAHDVRELETFMINSWNGSLAQDDDYETYFITFEGEF